MDEINLIRVPRALPGLEPLVLDIADLRKAEARMMEVASTNALRAPELLATFNQAHLNAKRIWAQLQYEYDVAERQLAETKAVFLIDKLPQLLVDKGLASSRSPLGSEDIRQAFLDRDPDYKKYQDLLLNIRCYLTLMTTLAEAFENSYNSVKKLVGTDGHSTYRQNPNLVQTLTEDNSPTDFFGKPR